VTRDATATASPGAVAAWALTGRISPRRVVRAAALDAAGQPLNSYRLVHPVTGSEPRTPWAVHLADAAGRYRLLCADLDAKASPDAAAADADRLASLLAELGIEHLVCASGQTGGRHVWLGLVESLDAEVVRALAHLLKAWLPTLDLAPLTNPTSGCVRPPGAPHRLGGSSRVIAGSASVLTDPTVTTDQVHALMTRLADFVQTTTPTQTARRRPVAEVDGLPFLPGPKRALSASCRALLDTPPTGDLSAVLWRVLCGAAAARWRYADLAALADAPGFEHVRSLRAGAMRVPRPRRGPASPAAVLRRQWTRAVHAVAALAPGQQGADATFETRAEIVTEMVRAVQRRADATPGRWGRSRAGLAQRRVLDALCLFHLQGVRADEVEADIRRLGLTCGLDRETARRSLLALAADGWIARTRQAAGRRGARWTIDPAGAVHTRVSVTLSQADPRPAGTGPALRTALLGELTDRLHASAHDAFAHQGGLGLAAGSLYGRLREPLDLLQCAQLQGWSIEQTTSLLQQLNAVGLIEGTGRCWQRTGPEHLDAASAEFGTDGVGQRRADRYALERALWAWWCTELDALCRARRHPGHRRLRQGVSRTPHPRGRDGRADFRAARRALAHPRVGSGEVVSFGGTHVSTAFLHLHSRCCPPGTHSTEQDQGSPGRVTPTPPNKIGSRNFGRGVRQRPFSSLLVGEGESR
jgi:hypothetical protein